MRNNIWYYVMKIIFIISYYVILTLTLIIDYWGAQNFHKTFLLVLTHVVFIISQKRTINLNFDFLFWQSSSFVKKKNSSPFTLKSFQFLIFGRIFLIEGTFSKLNNIEKLRWKEIR